MIAAGAVSSVGARKGFSTREAIPAAGADCGSSSREEADVHLCEPVAETQFDPVRVGGDQRVLGRKVGVDPFRGLVGGLELAETGEQPFPQRCRLLWPQK